MGEKAMDKGRLARMLGAGIICVSLAVGAQYLIKEIKEYTTTHQTSQTENNSSNLLYKLYTN
jgi:hypothetical protein